MEYDDFEQAIIFTFVRAEKRQMGAVDLMNAVFRDNSTMMLRARAIHDEGQRQAAQFLNFMQRIQDKGLVARIPGSAPLGDGDIPEGLGVFSYVLTDRVKFARVPLAVVANLGG